MKNQFRTCELNESGRNPMSQSADDSPIIDGDLLAAHLLESGAELSRMQDDLYNLVASRHRLLTVHSTDEQVEFEAIQDANHFFSKNETNLVKVLDKYIKKETALY